MSSYYDYYGCEKLSHLIPAIDNCEQINLWHKYGYNHEEAKKYINSGYIATNYESIIDRCYGGKILSVDGVRRFNPSDFRENVNGGRREISITRAKSAEEVFEAVEGIRNNSKRRLLFRGQTQNYSLKREVPNSHFEVDGLGEISLFPSVWRKFESAHLGGIHEFLAPEQFFWKKLFLSNFDQKEINKRIKRLAGDEVCYWNAFDLEDCTDSYLQSYGQILADIQMGATFNLYLNLATLLQHYGLVSPVLDLTSDINVALFFATNSMINNGGKPDYYFRGTNNRKSVLYIFDDVSEVATYRQERVAKYLKPLRPIKQSCVVVGSESHAMNLPADFLRHIIIFDFDIEKPFQLNAATLFPTSEEDLFLAALQREAPEILRKHIV